MAQVDWNLAMSIWALAIRCARAVEPALQPPPNWAEGTTAGRCCIACSRMEDKHGLDSEFVRKMSL
eukprot:12329806-Karenia_brevis.AAC.1